MQRDLVITTSQRRYELVETILALNIANRRLPSGFVLLEGPIAEALGVTRPPVQRALKNLQVRGLVRRFEGRGFLVDGPEAEAPQRGDIRTIPLEMPKNAEEALASRSTGERIFDIMESDITGCIVFGRYRIIETTLASYFQVSRTVVRDVLSRLEERGLICKTQSSHWTAGPLTANTIREHFAIRRLLEPPALEGAAAFCKAEALYDLLDQLARARAEGVSLTRNEINFEILFAEKCLFVNPNERLNTLIKDNFLPIRAVLNSLRQFGLPDSNETIIELHLVVELLLQGAVPAAVAMLDHHLKAAMRRHIAQIKIITILPEPKTIPSYLQQI